MLAVEILESVDVIPDPYVRAVTYARLGERLARARNSLFKDAFMKALDVARSIEDPLRMMRALLSIGYSMGRAGIRAYKKVFLQVFEDSKMLPPPVRDELLRSAALYLLNLGEIGESITYAVEISNEKLRQETLVYIVRAIARSFEENPMKVAYRLRKIRLALDYIADEPYRSKALLELIKALITLKSYENALAVLREINSKEWARQAFKEVTFRLKESGVLDRYIGSLEEIAGELVEKFGESFTLELGTAFALTGRGDLAVAVLRKAENGLELLKKTAVELLEKYPDVLPSFIEALDEVEAEDVGKAVMNRILENPELGRWEVIRAVAKKTRSEEVWAKIARYHVLVGDVEGARRIGNVLQSTKLRSLVMADVSHQYLKRGDVDKAIDAALEVREPKFTSILISEILVKALDKELSESGAHGKAEAVAGKKGR